MAGRGVLGADAGWARPEAARPDGSGMARRGEAVGAAEAAEAVGAAGTEGTARARLRGVNGAVDAKRGSGRARELSHVLICSAGGEGRGTPGVCGR